MTYVEIAEIIQEAAQAIGCEHTYREWPKGAAPEPPYILFYYPGREDFFADDRNYQHITALNVELYTDNKDFAAEAALEAVLERHGLTYTKHESYIESEQMYEALYEMEEQVNECK